MRRDFHKWKCGCCDTISLDSDLLRAANPFLPEKTLVACPECKDVNDFIEICDESGCEEEANCGFPVPDGYRRTCGTHYVPAGSR